MTVEDITEDDIQQARRNLKQRYREVTGECLPDHVLDNLELLGTHNLMDIIETNEEIREEIERLSDLEYEHEPPPDPWLMEDITATHVAFLAWIATAASYGYLTALYPTGGYPDIAGVFLVFGLSVGVAFTASVVAAFDGDDDE